MKKNEEQGKRREQNEDQILEALKHLRVQLPAEIAQDEKLRNQVDRRLKSNRRLLAALNDKFEPEAINAS